MTEYKIWNPLLTLSFDELDKTLVENDGVGMYCGKGRHNFAL